MMSFTFEQWYFQVAKLCDGLHGNRKKLASFSLTGPALVFEFLQYSLPVNVTSNYGSA